MSDYISRDVAIEAIKDHIKAFTSGREEYNIARRHMMELVEVLPAADVAPVKRGEWVGYPECLKYVNAYTDDHIVCSVCEECFSILDNDIGRFNFCPNCGADMRGWADE